MNLLYPYANKKLMTPGPVPLPEKVKEVFATCHVHHRTQDFGNLLSLVLQQLKSVFQTQEHCYILPATGTGAMEASLVNTLSPGDSVLVLQGGKFGERWAKISNKLGLKCDVFQVPWGRNIDLNRLETQLNGNQYKAMLFQACETSTGLTHPVEDISQLCRKSSTLSVVDGITALAAYSVPMDEWGIDVLVGGSQKGFMLPTGLSFVALSSLAQNLAKTSRFPKYYWDLHGEKLANDQGKTRYSTPTHFVLALNQVLESILCGKDGLALHFEEIQKRARHFRNRVELSLFPETPSPSLSCLELPTHIDGQKIQKKMYDEYNIMIAGGQDQLKGKVLRVGHMGAMSLKDLEETARCINGLLV